MHHNQQEAENASKSSLNSEAWVFMQQEYTNLFLTGKNVLIVMFPIFINKDVFEASYNDLFIYLFILYHVDGGAGTRAAPYLSICLFLFFFLNFT